MNLKNKYQDSSPSINILRRPCFEINERNEEKAFEIYQKLNCMSKIGS